MKTRLDRYLFLLIIAVSYFPAMAISSNQPITPNNFTGSDTERIQAAVNAARETTCKIVIPRENANGSNIWKIDQAILLPSNISIILDNCTIQLSDSCRD